MRKYKVVRRYLLEEYFEVEADNRFDAIRRVQRCEGTMTGDTLETSNCYDFTVKNKDGKILLEIDEHELPEEDSSSPLQSEELGPTSGSESQQDPTDTYRK